MLTTTIEASFNEADYTAFVTSDHTFPTLAKVQEAALEWRRSDFTLSAIYGIRVIDGVTSRVLLPAADVRPDNGLTATVKEVFDFTVNEVEIWRNSYGGDYTNWDGQVAVDYFCYDMSGDCPQTFQLNKITPAVEKEAVVLLDAWLAVKIANYVRDEEDDE